MLILGIDPGTATTGYGFVLVNGHGVEVLDFGLIETDKVDNPGVRLVEIHKRVSELIASRKPDAVAVERLFFATNAKTAMRVGQAQGVIMFSAALAKTAVFEYAPGTVKKLVTGDGRADKKAVQQSVRKVLGPRVRSAKHKKTHFDNAADALAVALCHAFTLNNG